MWKIVNNHSVFAPKVKLGHFSTNVAYNNCQCVQKTAGNFEH